MLSKLFGPAARLSAAETLIDMMHGVPSLPGERLEALMKEAPQGKLLLLDVREPEEYLMSHLENALQLSPSTGADQLRERLPEGYRGKTVVAYCSIGERSAVLLERLRDSFRDMGIEDLRNLRGGIFRWHADGRNMVDANGATNSIHPYNGLWGMLMSPETPAE
ncbi:MAG: rhodanese-like domain-containing protein [Chlorobiaceae bacterium]|nr:rhodanese-like domain-containing protein [Chlorobiaceae bacterium]